MLTQFLARLPIAAKIAIVGLAPTLGALGVGGYVLMTSQAKLAQLSQTATVADAAPAYGEFVHELQIERGLTNRMLRAGDEQAAKERAAHIARVDDRLERLAAANASAASALGAERAAAVLGDAATLRAKLAELRTEVAERRVMPAAIDRYTEWSSSRSSPSRRSPRTWMSARLSGPISSTRP